MAQWIGGFSEVTPPPIYTKYLGFLLLFSLYTAFLCKSKDKCKVRFKYRDGLQMVYMRKGMTKFSLLFRRYYFHYFICWG